MLHVEIQRIWIVKGEKCTEAQQPHPDRRSQAVVTSLPGSSSSDLTDCTAVRDAIDHGSDIVVLPVLDEREMSPRRCHAISP